MNVPIFESFGVLLAGIGRVWLWRFLAHRGVRLGVFVIVGILLSLGMGVFLVGMVVWMVIVSFTG